MAEFGNNFNYGESPLYKDEGLSYVDTIVSTLEQRDGDVFFGFDIASLTGAVYIIDNDLKRDTGLSTAVYIALFTDKRAFDTDILPNNQNDRRGWCFDNTLGSRLWLLERETINNEVMSKAEQYCREALQFLIDHEIATSIDIRIEVAEINVLLINITIKQTKQNINRFQYFYNWQNQTIGRV